MPFSTVIIEYSSIYMKKHKGHALLALIMSSKLELQVEVKPLFFQLAIDIN